MILTHENKGSNMAIFLKKSDTKLIDYKLKIPASFTQRLEEINKKLERFGDGLNCRMTKSC